jgi:hypothetical protein
VSSPTTVATPTIGTAARPFTEPLRELIAFVLLAGNGVFLILGFSGLFFVLDRWGSEFGLRSSAVFATFVGPYSLGLPIVAMLLATHVYPMVRRSKAVLIAVLVELAVSAFFGLVTFLGAFANDLASARATVEGLLWRSVWLAFLIFTCIVVVRLWLGLYPAAKTGPVSYPPTYRQPTYGSPYPGQPMYPQASFTPGAASPSYTRPETITDSAGWPIVPPPPVPAPLVIPVQLEPPGGEATTRIAAPTIEIGEREEQASASPAVANDEITGGDATQKIPAPVDSRAPAGSPAAPAEPGTDSTDR